MAHACLRSQVLCRYCTVVASTSLFPKDPCHHLQSPTKNPSPTESPMQASSAYRRFMFPADAFHLIKTSRDSEEGKNKEGEGEKERKDKKLYFGFYFSHLPPLFFQSPPTFLETQDLPQARTINGISHPASSLPLSWRATWMPVSVSLSPRLLR